MKQSILLFILCLVLTACGGSDEKNADMSQTAAVTASETDSDKNVLHQMPDSDQIDDAYEAILEKAGTDDPELLEVYVNFSKSIIGADRDEAHMSLQMASPDNKNKVVAYRYNFGNEQVAGPQEVTLSSGIGASETFIDTYDGFKQVLFRKADIMDFDKADEVYEKAIAQSGYAPDDCYVQQLSFKYNPSAGKLQGDVAVQSTRSTTAHKSFAIDKEGNIRPF